jgi:hypothetical protein
MAAQDLQDAAREVLATYTDQIEAEKGGTT